VRTIERYHLALREIGCIVCHMLDLGTTPPEIHHLFDAHARDDRLVAPLCPPHHRGAKGVVGFHPGGERRFQAAYGFGEREMLAETIQRYAESRR
jgi:hypothetical protein